MSIINEYFENRKTFLSVAGVCLFIGAVVGKALLWIMAIGAMAYFVINVIKKKGVKKFDSNYNSENQKDVHNADFSTKEN